MSSIVNLTNDPLQPSEQLVVSPPTSKDPNYVSPDQPSCSPKRKRGRPKKQSPLPAADLTVGAWIESLSVVELKKRLQLMHTASTGNKLKLAEKLKMALDVDDSSLAVSSIPRQVLLDLA
jgi:hypothetical protein